MASGEPVSVGTLNAETENKTSSEIMCENSGSTFSAENGIERDTDSLVDRLVEMATKDDDDDDDEGDFLSASSGESDDEKFAELSESASGPANVDDRNIFSRIEECNDASAIFKDSRQDVEYNPSNFPSADDTLQNSSSNRESGDVGDREGAVGDSGDADGDGGGSGAESKKARDEEKEKEEKEEQKRREEEDALTEEERQARLGEAVEVKAEGNIAFKAGNFQEAFDLYTKGLELCPLKYVQQRSIMLSNRAACRMKEEDFEAVVKDCSKAIDLNPTYVKAISRRAEAYERLDKLDDAHQDYKKILELEPSQATYQTCMRLEKEINERNEKMKAEMLGKLKDLGNMILRPFGLSTNNFQMQQDPNTGGYSMQFVNSPPNNGK